MDFQTVIGDADGLFETWHTFVDLHIYPAVGADETAQVVLFDDLVWEEIQGEFHALLTGYGGDVVEIFNVYHHELGVGGENGAVEKTLCGG